MADTRTGVRSGLKPPGARLGGDAEAAAKGSSGRQLEANAETNAHGHAECCRHGAENGRAPAGAAGHRQRSSHV